jgi:hypothetical protein
VSAQAVAFLGLRIVLEEHVVLSTSKEILEGPVLEDEGVKMPRSRTVKVVGSEQVVSRI